MRTTVRCQRSNEVLAVVDMWYRLRWGESCGWAGDREYEYALSLIDAHGLDEVLAVLPRAVALTRELWPKGRTLSAVRRYWSQAVAERTHQRLECERLEREQHEREERRQDEREKERERKRHEQRERERWESLTVSERDAIRQQVAHAHPSFDRDGKLFEVLCIARMNELISGSKS